MTEDEKREQQKIKKEEEEINKIVASFDENFKHSKHYHPTYKSIFIKIMKDKEITEELFCDLLGLSPRTYKRYCDCENDPSLKTLTAFCVVFEVDFNNFIDLLRAGGYGIDFSNKTQYAYTYLIQKCSGKTTKFCNRVLEELGIPKKDWLKEPEI